MFAAAGVYGLIVLAPQLFLEGAVGRYDPPAVTHPEYFYGFVGVALAWQVAFLVIARDPQRLRPLMPVAALEKFVWAAATAVLFLGGRVSGAVFGFGMLDLCLGVLFLVCYRRTPGGAVLAADAADARR